MLCWIWWVFKRFIETVLWYKNLAEISIFLVLKFNSIFHKVFETLSHKREKSSWWGHSKMLHFLKHKGFWNLWGLYHSADWGQDSCNESPKCRYPRGEGLGTKMCYIYYPNSFKLLFGFHSQWKQLGFNGKSQIKVLTKAKGRASVSLIFKDKWTRGSNED